TFVERLDEAAARRLGPLLESHPAFPNRTNVQFARVAGRDAVDILIWERGAGFTLASGSSSCGAAAAAVRNGRCDPGRVRVRMPGGEVIGVIPGPLATPELAHTGLHELRVVGSMHERKATMAALADGFVALPGGLGTFEETLEVLTWAQLGIHTKPVGVLDVEGYWEGLRRLLAHAVDERFVRPEYTALLLWGATPAELLDRLAAWRPPAGARAWLRP